MVTNAAVAQGELWREEKDLYQPVFVPVDEDAVLGWLRRLPYEAIRSRPRLCVYQAFLMLFDSRPLAEIENVLRAAEEADPKAGEAILIRAVLALLQGEIEMAAEQGVVNAIEPVRLEHLSADGEAVLSSCAHMSGTFAAE